MIKKTTFFVQFLLMIAFGLNAQVQVGTGTNTNQRLPFHAQFGFSYTQSIYLASEINAAGDITSIQWYYAGNGDLTNSQQLVIFMGNTTKTAYESTTDWVPLSELTQVYSGGIVTNGTPGWKTITLTTPFPYNGTDNLVVAVDENQEQWDDYSDRFHNTAVADARSIYVYFDYDNIDPANPQEAYNIVGFVPTVIFGGIAQACPTPFYVSADNITTTTAHIVWQAPVNVPAGGSDYYLSNTDAAPTAATEPTGNVASGVTVGFDNLTPETEYYIWVRSNCGDNLYSGWSAVYRFKTDCVAVTSFFEDFDAVNTPDLPSCWNKIMRGGNNLSPYARIETSNWYSQSPSNSIVMDSDLSDETLADVILASPHLSNLSAGTHRLKFYAKGNGNLQIGTLTTNDNNAIFTENATGNIDTNSSMTEYVIDFSNYTGTDQYIGIRLATPSSTVYIDNVKWEVLPTCPDVTAITVPYVTPSGATIEWVTGNPAASVSWDVAIGSSSDSDPDTLSSVNATETTKQIEGLSENTNYKVWVRTVCSAENGAWIGPVYFTTACQGIDNFYENFSAATDTELPGCWRKILRGSGLSEFSDLEVTQYSYLFEEGNSAVKLFTDNGNSTEDLILVSPNLTSLPLGTHRLKFYAKHDFTPANIDIVTLSSNTASADATLIQTVQLNSDTTQYLVNFADYTGTDTYIGFRLHATESYSSVYIDNILWELDPSCPDVTLVTVPETTAVTATVTWTPSGDEESWDVAVGNDTDDPTSVPFTNYTEIPAIIPDLTDNTTYNVWVRSVCSGNDKGAWIGPLAFTTACLPVAAFSENFETVVTPELASCWGKILRGATVSPYAQIETTPWSNLPEPTTAVVIKTSDSGGDDDIILVSPSVNTLGLGTYRLKFKAKGAATLYVGTLNANTDAAVFTPLQTVTSTEIVTQYVVDFSGYSGTDSFIGIRVDSGIQYTYVEIDNIVWQLIPDCPDVNDLQKTGTTMTTASISWNGGTANQWEMAIGDTSDTDPTALIAIPVSDAAHTFENLTAGTSYNIWVHSQCETPLGNGEWAGPLKITTQCEGTDIPYLEDFETAANPGLPDCTSGIKIAAAPAEWYTSYYPGYGFESNTLTYNGDLFTDANSWFFTRGINLTAGESYTITYRYGGASTDTFFYNNSLKVMYGNEASPDSMTMPIAEHLDFALDSPMVDAITITAPYTGVFYFGFNVISPNNSYYMYIDDIAVDVETLSVGGFEKGKLTYYPNPVTDVLHFTATDAIDSVSIYTLLGQEVITKTVSANGADIDMSFLAKGTYLARVTIGKTVKNIKVIKS
ncbi:MAG: T9SS type A sorting domain-containing protein [Flavobacterium sp.]|nr:T9SS type A sorting domain-containing protein [Flavobacterium sp.]